MIKKIGKAAAMVVASTMLISCGDDNPIQRGVNELTEEGQKIQIREKWASECFESTILNSAVKEYWDFDAKTFEHRYDLFSDVGCTESSGTVNMTGEFDIQANEEQDDTYDLNLRYNEVKVTPKSDFATGVLSAINFCGIEKWNNGEEKIIGSNTGENCFVSEVPEDRYGKVNIDDSEDKLYLSESFSKESENRPETVDESKAFNEVKD